MFERLSQSQTPEVLFITCSDSRIDPNLLTQTQPGELFIIRNVGNIIPTYGAIYSGEGAAIEYAVHTLGVKDLLLTTLVTGNFQAYTSEKTPSNQAPNNRKNPTLLLKINHCHRGLRSINLTESLLRVRM